VTRDYNDVYGLEQLSYANFPCLSKITTTARALDLTALPLNPALEKLVVAEKTKVKFIVPLAMNFPNLDIVYVDFDFLSL